ncbi:MAG: T9SS type B sorting domain-containing protein [Paludibacteraceae bacterium]|nr:T9SS type B sorting domain-containing protein [Paludibacteraceae bacterium]
MNQVWTDDFGVVDDSTRIDFADPSKSMPGHTFQGDTTASVQDGSYAIANSTYWCFTVHQPNAQHFFTNGRDHTGNENGGMLVVNTDGTLEGQVIYEQKINFPLCSNNDYYFSIYAASITSFSCTPANLILRILGDDGSTIEELSTDSIPFWEMYGPDSNNPKAEHKWSEYGIKFNSSGNNSITLQVVNNALCTKDKKASELEPWESCEAGNDFALDDITLYRFDTEDVPDPDIESSTISAINQNQGCRYTSSYSIADSILTKWKTLYDKIYFLWQESENGFTWTDIPEPTSGIDKRKAQMEVDVTKNIRYRVIITGAETEAKAKEVAGQISTNGGPDDGCYKFSISNTLAASKPRANCTYSKDLMSIFNEDFGTATSTDFNACADVQNLTLFNGDSPTAGGYALVSDPKNTKKNDWDTGNPRPNDHTGDIDGAMLYAILPKVTTPTVFYEKTLNAKFCSCKTYMFSLFADINQQWSEATFTAVVLNNNKDTLSATGCKVSAGGTLEYSWTHFYADFIVPENYQGDITLQLINTNTTQDRQIVFDDISVLICGEKLPTASLFIEKDPVLTDLSDFPCEEKKEIDLSDLTDWQDEFGSSVYCLWQRSDNGGLTWQTLTESGNDVQSITSTSSEDGTKELYRVVLAENSIVANEVATNGIASDGCDKFFITNEVSLQCTPPTCEFAEDRLVVWKDDFGSVAPNSRKESSNLKGHDYRSSGNTDDGEYSVVSDTKYAANWFSGGRDHTGNKDGGLIVINIDEAMKDKVIYEQKIDFEPCANTDYFFSTFATSISKRLANGDTEGVYCNLTFEIVGEDGITVLGKEDSGDIPNSPFGTSIWNNYGVSFNSGDNKSITLRIYDHAGNGDKGNDLAMDDISLISCHVKAPLVELTADKDTNYTGICGDSVTLELSDLTDWNKIYGAKLYCLFQKSLDEGVTWESMNESGYNIDSVKILLESNPNGTRYRVVISGPEPEIPQQIAAKGRPDNSCYVYTITNISTVSCHCDVPDISLELTDSVICSNHTEMVQLIATYDQTATIDSIVWAYKEMGETEWTKGTDDSDTLSVLPTIDTEYRVYAVNDTCHSDTIHAKIRVSKAIKLKLPTDTIVCEGSNIELTDVLVEGNPTKYMWDNTETNQDNHTVVGVIKETEITLSANDSVCFSDTLTLNITVQDSIRGTISKDTTVCEGDPITIKTSVTGFINSYTWEAKKGTETVYTTITEGTQTEYSIGSADENQQTRITYVGDKCPSLILENNFDVIHPTKIDLSSDKDSICEQSSVNLTVNGTNINVLNWMSRTDSTAPFVSFDQSTDITKTLTPTQSTQYRITAEGTGQCPSGITNIVTIFVEDSVKFEAGLDKDTICLGSEMTISVSNYNFDADLLKWESKKTGDSNFSEITTATGFSHKESPTSPTDYRVSVEAKVCPSKSETLHVEIEEPTTLSLNISDNLVCVNSEVTIDFDATNFDHVSFISRPADDSSIEQPKEENFMEDGSGAKTRQEVITENRIFELKQTQTAVCPLAEPISVLVEKEDSIKFSLTKDQTICKGTEISIRAKLKEGKLDQSTFTKKIGGNAEEVFVPESTTFDETPSETTVYKVTFSGSVCPAVTKTSTVTVEQPAKLELLADKNRICTNSTTRLFAQVSNADSIRWEVHTVSSSQFETIDETPIQNKDVTLTETSIFRIVSIGENVCPKEASNEIEIIVDDSIRLAYDPIPESICSGTVIDLNATLLTGAYLDFGWRRKSQTTNTTVSQTLNAKDTPTEDCEYTLYANSAYCPTLVITIPVKVETPVIPVISASTKGICQNDEVQLSAQYGATTSVKWEKKEEGETDYSTFSTEISTQKTDNPTKSSTYRITVSGSQICPDIKSNEIAVEVEDSVRITLEGENKLCPGQNVELKAITEGTPLSIIWDDVTENGQIATDKKSIFVKPSVTTKYQVSATAKYCPTATDTQTVYVDFVPTFNLSISTDSICEGEEITVSTDFPYETSLVWEQAAINSNTFSALTTGSQTLILSPQKSTKYKVTAFTESGCPAGNKTTTINVDAKVNVNLADTSICYGESTYLQSSPFNTSYKYQWATTPNFSEIDYEGNRILVNPKETTTYYLRATNGLCKEEKSTTVTVAPLPTITSYEYVGYHSIAFNANGGTGSYEYNFGSGFTTSNVFEKIHYSTTYTIRIKDELGCMDDTTLTTPTYHIIVPDFFTPDGDGTNDVWKISNLDKFEVFTVQIFDRFGKQLYQYNDPTMSWDGTYNGNEMPSTDYWYIINIEEIDRQYVGHFTLLRR